VKLPSQFASLAPKVREFFEEKAFGKTVALDDKAVIGAMSTNVAHFVCVQTFKRALLGLTIEEQKPELLEPNRMLSSMEPFPWSRPVWEGQRCILNLVPCDNAFERTFAKFLDGVSDVAAYSKLPQPFGFAIEYADPNMSLRAYYPDFVAKDITGTHWLIETKGQETAEVQTKDQAATRWCEDATVLTGTPWRYLKVAQKHFEQFQAATLADLVTTSVLPLFPSGKP
jgi:type III restriction enzyme